MKYCVEPLGDHQLVNFKCGNAELDKWLREHAPIATGYGTRTYVLVDRDEVVVGYFALTPHLLARKEVPRRLARGAPEQIPAILLVKLALDTSVQRQGLGSELLVVALNIITVAARRVGGRVVVVDAINDEARNFYVRHDFVGLPGQPNRLVMKLSSVARALGAQWP